MDSQQQKRINDYFNRPSGIIKQVYPIVGEVEIRFHKGLGGLGGNVGHLRGRIDEWMSVGIFLNKHFDYLDFWDLDWPYMIENHIMGDMEKFFNMKKLPYSAAVYTPSRERKGVYNYLGGTEDWGVPLIIP